MTFNKGTTNMLEREQILKNLNITLDNIDDLVKQGILTRRELTDIVCRRNILAMKQVLKYAKYNTGK
jgi:hypothetical protein